MTLDTFCPFNAQCSKWHIVNLSLLPALHHPPAPPPGYQKNSRHPKAKKHENKAASLCYNGQNMAGLNVFQPNFFAINIFGIMSSL